MSRRYFLENENRTFFYSLYFWQNWNIELTLSEGMTKELYYTICRSIYPFVFRNTYQMILENNCALQITLNILVILTYLKWSTRQINHVFCRTNTISVFSWNCLTIICILWSWNFRRGCLIEMKLQTKIQTVTIQKVLVLRSNHKN